LPNFLCCLIGFQLGLVVSLAGLKCGKGKFIEAVAFVARLQLWISVVQSPFVAEALHSVFVGITAIT